MSGFFDFIKSLLLPFLLAALLYALITLLLLPLYRRHRNKYSQYLPLSSPSLPTYTSASTTGGGPLQRPLHIAFNIFTITVDTINTLLPERWKSRKQTVVSASDGFDEEGFGEEMGGDGANGGGYTSEGDDVHIAGVTDAHGIGSGRRRDGLSLSMDAMNALRNGDGRGASRGRGWGSGRNGDRDDSGRRLSRELEEGFADSSDEDEEEDVRREERTPSQRRGVR
ncbi:hypothetical protein EJ08DRAFT_651134 [Tothia fuscella]|uniref:Uncharacterized protein n=1 Tax=Tothia fuscella TaxID=1048955 RepID=A0A9P4NMS5_9PEZI|nr:hypothetical protein EJ08DRAFT_651134 [Tothia fuscella]